MKARINGLEGELLYPIVVGSPVYLLYSKGGTKIEEVVEILDSTIPETLNQPLVTKFRTENKEYYVEYT